MLDSGTSCAASCEGNSNSKTCRRRRSKMDIVNRLISLGILLQLIANIGKFSFLLSSLLSPSRSSSLKVVPEKKLTRARMKKKDKS